MIIDLTVTLSVIHDFWDVFGVILGGMLIVFVPIVSILSLTLYVKDKLKSTNTTNKE